MKLELIRDTYTENSTIGKLYIDGVFECYTLEPKDRHIEDGGVKVPNKTAIPIGSYKLEWRFSPHFNTYTPHYLDVPNFEYVLIHWGNYPKDTDACTLVGKTKGIDFVGSSKDEFAALMAKIEQPIKNGDVTIEVSRK